MNRFERGRGRRRVVGVLCAIGLLPLVAAADAPHVWVFSATADARHASIGAGHALIQRLAGEGGFTSEVIEDPARFVSGALDGVAVVVFLNVTGSVLDDEQRQVFRASIERGVGFVGVHGAAAAEPDWPWYGQLLGGNARFIEHPPVQPVTLFVRTPAHPSVRELPASFSFTDEWYVFRQHPGPSVQLLLTLDARELAGRTMHPNHPVAWFHQVGAGRAWYTALGHRSETYSDPRFVEHLRGGLQWAGNFESPVPPEYSPVLAVASAMFAVVAVWVLARRVVSQRRSTDA